MATLASLATNVVRSDDRSQYERARAATALGHELATLRHLDIEDVRAGLGDTKKLEDALLDLVGFAYVFSLSSPHASAAGLGNSDCGTNGVEERASICRQESF